MAILVNPFSMLMDSNLSSSCDWTECQQSGCDGYNGCNT